MFNLRFNTNITIKIPILQDIYELKKKIFDRRGGF